MGITGLAGARGAAGIRKRAKGRREREEGKGRAYRQRRCGQGGGLRRILVYRSAK